MNKNTIYLTLSVFLLLIGYWVFSNYREAKTGQLAPREQTNLKPVKNKEESASVSTAIHPEKMTKTEMVKEIWKATNEAPQDLYGKVVDQYGKAVADARIDADLMFIRGMDVPERIEKHSTQTNRNGEFEFTGIRGWKLGAAPSKEGYAFKGIGTAMKMPESGTTSPADRAIFTMWKLKGAEPLIEDEKFYAINPDGRQYAIDLLQRKKYEGRMTGDLLVRIQRPRQISSQAKFDWIFTLDVIDGGVVEAGGIYLNEAPEEGYQSSYKISMLSTAKDWSEEIKKTFYLKSRNGQMYGWITFEVIPNYNDGAIFKFKSLVNPAGSRNLEFDPTKQIKP